MDRTHIGCFALTFVMSHEELVAIVAAIDKRVSTLESTGTYKRPTREAFQLHAEKIGLPPDQEEWAWNYYESNGWKVGRNPMRNWQAALINWRKNWQAKGTGVGTTNGHKSLSIWEMKEAMEAKQSRCKELSDRHYNDSGAFHEWTSQPARQEFIILKKQIKELQAKIGASA